jgi:hypothetical protein
MHKVSDRLLFFAALAIAVTISGCQSVYYNTMEKFGYQKREILVDRVKDARDENKKTAEQFNSALAQFSQVVNFEGGNLEEKHEQLNAEFQRCESSAEAVKKRIAAVEDVGEALFDEWEAELKQYTNTKLRRASQQKLVRTRRQYDQLIRSMKRAESKIDPVLSAFRDQVLYLKHNLNAKAIASLQTELISVENNVASLVREMEEAISEADGFIKAMGETT